MHLVAYKICDVALPCVKKKEIKKVSKRGGDVVILVVLPRRARSC